MRRPLLLLACGMVLVARSLSAAQIFEGLADPALQYDPSVRSTGMAGASGAVFWVTDPNHWANPALLGTVQGIQYQDALEQFPTLFVGNSSFDARFVSRQAVLGGGGLGVALAGAPFEGMGSSWQGAVNGAGWEELSTIRSWSAGVSAAKVLETSAWLLHRSPPRILRHLDLAFGYTHKGGDDRPTISDWGLLAHVSGQVSLRGVATILEAGYGYSDLNSNQNPDRHVRNSAGIHVAGGDLPKGFARLPAWFLTGLEPLVSLGGAFDLDRRAGGLHEHLWGGELGLVNVLFLRFGRNEAFVSDHDDFRGFGVALPLGKFAAVRYDDARQEGEFSSDIDYRAWSVWIDPLAIARAGR